MLYLYERRPKMQKNDFWGIFLSWPPFCRKCTEWALLPKVPIFRCPKIHFFAFLVFFHIDTTYIKLDWNSDNFLIFWCTLMSMVMVVMKIMTIDVKVKRHHILFQRSQKKRKVQKIEDKCSRKPRTSPHEDHPLFFCTLP